MRAGIRHSSTSPSAYDEAPESQPSAISPVKNRSPAEVSFYLGLATAIATFSAAAVALGLLQCSRWRERLVAVAVLLCGTLGIGAALATVARGRTSGVGNVLIGVGVVVAAAYVLMQALRLIFTIRGTPEPWKYITTRSSQTQRLSVTWTSRSRGEGGFVGDGANSRTPGFAMPGPAAGLLHRQLWMTAATFVAAVTLAAVVALPDLFEGFLRSRPVGSGSAGGAPRVTPLNPGIMTNAQGRVTLCTEEGGVGIQRKTISDFNARFGPDLRATLVEFPLLADQQYQQFSRLQRARSGKCDVYYSDVVWTADFAHHGWLQDLSRYVERRGREFVPAMLETASFDGRQWGVPEQADAGLLFYRKDRISVPPTTWQALYRRAAPTKRLRYQASAYEGLTVNFLEIAYAAGAQNIVTANRYAHVEQVGALAALQLMVEGLRLGVAPREVVSQTEESSLEAFVRGRADFMRNWPYAYTALQRSKVYSKIRRHLGVAALPRWNGRPPATVLAGHNLVISRFSRNPAAALKLVDYLSSPTVVKQNAIDQSLMPALVALWQDREVQRALPAFAKLRDAIETARPRPVVPNYQAVSQAISTNVNRALRGDLSPAQALTLANDEMQQALDSAYGGAPG
jgi:multiple sugar transport system substrate-binding protein